MKINHQRTHGSEGLPHSTGRSASAPRLKSAVKKVASYVVILLK